jgi:aspartyl/asparaginyl beta-hydroxylase (cupin superfamily)
MKLSTEDPQAVLSATASALLRNPRDPQALASRALALADLGRLGEASTTYREAVREAQAAPPTRELQALLQRGQAIAGLVGQAFEATAKSRLAAHAAGQPIPPRVSQALEIQLGHRQIFVQQPLKFYFPGLPQIEFYDRSDFAWAKDLEAQTAAIRAELQAVLQRQAAFAPYVEAPKSGRSDPSGMAGNADWSACFLVKNGKPNPGWIDACPLTMAALANVPVSAMPARGPSILFSALKPGARIPPHHGFVNTRLICHLPLIAPPGCFLRVGSQTREWREGELVVFDDSIEHEAWNASNALRVVLLFDIWRPELSEIERNLVNEIFAAVDETSGQAAAWDV